MNFAPVFKGLLHSLIAAAEAQLGAGKGAEKKAWVLAKLREALVAAKWQGWLIEVVVGVASVLVEVLLKEALELLGK